MRALAERIAEDILEESKTLGLKDEVLTSRAVRRMKSALTNDAIYSSAPSLVSGAEWGTLNASQLQALQAMYNDAMKLTIADRELLATMLNQASIKATQAGVSILSDELTAAYYLAKFITEKANEKPLWAAALNVTEYEKVRRMGLRWDLKDMLADSPDFIKEVINNSEHFDVLRGAAFQDVNQLKQAIDRAENLIKTPKGVFDDADPKLGSPKGFHIKAQHYKGTNAVSITAFRGNQKIGHFQRALKTLKQASYSGNTIQSPQADWLRQLGDDAKVFEFQEASLYADTGVSSMLTAVKNPMIEGKGTPWSTFLNVRAMRELGIEFGDASLKLVKLSTVVNKKTMLQIDWLKQVYPSESLDELIKYTHSYKYAETSLRQAGFRLKRAHVTAAEQAVPAFQKAWGGPTAFGRGVGRNGEFDFMERHGFLNPSRFIERGHDVFLELESIIN